MEAFKETVTWLDYITIIFAFITMIITILNLIIGFIRNRKLEQDINIILKCRTESKELPHTVKRRHFTRSEIQGILANCYSERLYNIPYLGKKEYSEQIIAIQNNKFHTLIIPIEDKTEYDKFIIS